MKRPFQLLSIGMMAGALSIVPAVAQTGPDPNGAAVRSGAGSSSAIPGDMNSPNRRDDNDRSFNLGWLGLVGLAGLLGMRRNSHTSLDRVASNDNARNTDNIGPSGLR